MAEQNAAPEENTADITQDDRIWSLLSWLPWVGWILAIIVLLIEPKKARPFIRYNAVQALAASAAMAVAEVVFSAVSFCILGVVLAIVWLAFLYPAIQAYQGEWVIIPFLTDFCKRQDWI